MNTIAAAVSLAALTLLPCCGPNPNADESAPTDLPDEVEVVELVAFDHSTCALDSGGGLRCWGSGGQGLLGYGESENIGDDEDWCSVGPVAVGGPVHDVQELGGKCAMLDSGEARCWGPGIFGFAFTGAEQLPFEGLKIEACPRVERLVQGVNHACALLEDGAVRCWGAGRELGYGDSIDRGIGADPNEILAELPDLALGGPALSIEAGTSVVGGHTCALLLDGGVRCWGTDSALGYGSQEPIGDDETPAEAGDVPLGGAAIGLASAGSNWCALLEDHSLRCWGRDAAYGMLGYGDIFSETERVGDDETPADMGPVDIGEPVEAVFMGGLRTCVLLEGDRIRCWGHGLMPGLLGYGPSITRLYEPPSEDIDIGVGVRDLALGLKHTCALLDNGRIRCWGLNSEGQLGLGDPDLAWTEGIPAEVPLIADCWGA
ncbi:hypothetical protein ENSA5_04850 [Enhygromyxa salina]|uniref:Regulator of chromosome condensation (RCC1) repeat protein n=1 Tax=Enhygromyxa salina TaxID=215803 RepID=A0A2S9YI17_9BACT|nr:hypothetical protein [Enhygromyxa salina]PRQ04720.1 hypothetical protein ENSA5_04850 [Enhygromyxa salina]